MLLLLLLLISAVCAAVPVRYINPCGYKVINNNSSIVYDAKLMALHTRLNIQLHEDFQFITNMDNELIYKYYLKKIISYHRVPYHRFIYQLQIYHVLFLLLEKVTPSDFVTIVLKQIVYLRCTFDHVTFRILPYRRIKKYLPKIKTAPISLVHILSNILVQQLSYQRNSRVIINKKVSRTSYKYFLNILKSN